MTLSPESLVSVQSDQCGAIVWWRLSGVVALDALTAAWEAEGLDPDALPTPPSPRVALRRTAHAIRQSAEAVHVLHDGAVAIGRVVEEDAEGGTDKLRVAVRGAVKLDEAGALLVRGDLDANLAQSTFDIQRGTLSQGDVSDWLSRMVASVDAVPLRDTGGIYFVPRYSLERWTSMLRAVRAASSHTVSSVPAMTTAEAAAAFLDAMRVAAAKAAAEMAADVVALDESGNPRLGARALRSRVTRTEAIEKQLGAYEEVLGGKLDDVREQIMQVRAQLSVAMIKADAADDVADAAE